MPLQRLTMGSDYSERLINPLRQKSDRISPRAILIASTPPTTPVTSIPAFFNSPLLRSMSKPHPFRPRTIGDDFERRLESYGYYDHALKFEFKTRKFATFSADEEVALGRESAPTLCSQHRQAILESPSAQFNPFHCLLSAQSSVGQRTAENPEDLDPFPGFQHPASDSTSLQRSGSSRSDVPVGNWREAVVSSCVVGVALVAVAAGYACTTVFRGALNVGQFIYSNRDNIQEACTACTKAVQSTYNAAKRRLVSIPVPRLPVGMRRRYAPPSTPQSRSRQRRSFWQSRTRAQSPAQPFAPTNPVVSILAPDGMPGVEYSGHSNEGQFADRQDAADQDAFVYPRSSGDLVPDVPYMSGGLFHEPSPPPSAPSIVQDKPASINPSNNGDKRVVAAELFGDDDNMELEQDFLALPPLGQFESKSPSEAPKSLTNPQARTKSASPVIETASSVLEIVSPVFETASIIKASAPVIEQASPMNKASAHVMEQASSINKASALAIEHASPTIEASAPVIEHASPIITASAPVIEHTSPIIAPGSPVIEAGSSHQSPPPPSSLPNPIILESGPPTPSPPAKANARRAPTRAKTRKRGTAPGEKKPKMESPREPRKRPRTPSKPTRRSNRIAELNKR